MLRCAVEGCTSLPSQRTFCTNNKPMPLTTPFNTFSLDSPFTISSVFKRPLNPTKISTRPFSLSDKTKTDFKLPI